MKSAILILMLLLAGCATPSNAERGTRNAETHTLSQSVILPAAVMLHIGFANGTNWVTDNGWTNEWSFTALVTTDLTQPLCQWQPIAPALEMYNGLLTFQLVGSGPQLFCRAVYQPK